MAGTRENIPPKRGIFAPGMRRIALGGMSMAKTWEMLAVFGVNILIILLLQGLL
jgi:hypothetical protein